MGQFDRIIERRKQLDPHLTSRPEIHHTRSGNYPCSIILNFGGYGPHTGVTLVSGLDLEKAEEIVTELEATKKLKHSHNAVKFYLDCDSQQQWAIREFIRANSGDNCIADELLQAEEYLTNRREKLIKLGLPLNQIFEPFVKDDK